MTEENRELLESAEARAKEKGYTAGLIKGFKRGISSGREEAFCDRITAVGIDQVHAPDLEEANYRRMYEGEEAGYQEGLKIARKELFDSTLVSLCRLITKSGLSAEEAFEILGIPEEPISAL